MEQNPPYSTVCLGVAEVPGTGLKAGQKEGAQVGLLGLMSVVHISEDEHHPLSPT